ncbi:predicted protein [Coccidioides posadasii str. Silveira]|uniref:Predicted protein n=1 Tax=Coccidioides posadasii (strain RMSCC 757 / Silveira) TaxID=443226 RepID=E9DH94_COCPS|nr:predicted protein [Coccidioides posadasii str. Silveira]
MRHILRSQISLLILGKKKKVKTMHPSLPTQHMGRRLASIAGTNCQACMYEQCGPATASHEKKLEKNSILQSLSSLYYVCVRPSTSGRDNSLFHRTACGYM